MQELQRPRREQAEALLRVGVRLDGDTVLCARADGEAMQPRSLTHEFSYMIGRMPDLPRGRFLDLHHTHATQLLSAEVHPRVEQERLGHCAIATTLDLYSHVSETMQEYAAVKIEAALRGKFVGKADLVGRRNKKILGIAISWMGGRAV